MKTKDTTKDSHPKDLNVETVDLTEEHLAEALATSGAGRIRRKENREYAQRGVEKEADGGILKVEPVQKD